MKIGFIWFILKFLVFESHFQFVYSRRRIITLHDGGHFHMNNKF